MKSCSVHPALGLLVCVCGGARFEAWLEPGNTASQGVLRGARFEQAGCLRNFLNIEGPPSDALVFSIIPQEH